MNGRDDKIRQFAFLAAVSDYSKLVGVEGGRILGAAVTGPVAEAYVGGGS